MAAPTGREGANKLKIENGKWKMENGKWGNKNNSPKRKRRDYLHRCKTMIT